MPVPERGSLPLPLWTRGQAWLGTALLSLHILAVRVGEQNPVSEHQNTRIAEQELQPRAACSYFLKLPCAPDSLRELVKHKPSLALPGDCFRHSPAFLQLSHEADHACPSEPWEPGGTV